MRIHARRRIAAIALGAAAAVASLPAGSDREPGAGRAFAQEGVPAPQPFDPVYLERIEGDLAALVADATRLLAAREWDAAAVRLQALAEATTGEARDRVVLTSVGGPGREPLHRGFPEHMRAWFARLPAAALRAYRRAADPRAGTILAEAIARRDEAALESGIARWLFATRGEDAAVLLGDLYLERGEALGALSTYELVGRHLGEKARARVADRLEMARGALARRAQAGALDAGAEDVPDIAALLAGGATRVPIPLVGKDEPPLASNVFAEPVEVPGGGIAIVRPGRIEVLRPPAEPGAEREIVRLPPGGEWRGGPGPGPLRLGAAADGRILCAAIDHARLLDGDDGPIPGVEPAEDPLGRGPPAPPAPPIAPGRRFRGEVAPTSFDLFAFDVERGDRLLWTTAETGRYPGEEAWLAGVEWTSVPIVGAGAVFGAAITHGGEPEIHLAAFDAGAPGRLRWRRFLCARGFPAHEREEMPPIQPALALVGGTLVVDTGIGLVAGLDAFRGEVRWLARCGRARLESRPWRRRWPGGSPVAGPVEAWPPSVVAADGAAIFAPSDESALFAVQADTGRVLWRAATEEPLRPLALVGPALLAAGADEVALFDRASGKRRGEPLQLPKPLAGRPAIFEGGPGSRSPVLVLLPVRGAILAVAIERLRVAAEPRLVPVGVLALSFMERGDLVPIGGRGAAYVDPHSVTLLVPAEEGAAVGAALDVGAIVDLYGTAAPAAEIDTALEELRVRAAAARGEPVEVAPNPDPDPAFTIEPPRDGEAIVARARFQSRAGRPRVAVTIDRDGRMIVETSRAGD